MSANERRDLALAELSPNSVALVLRRGDSEDQGYIVRNNMTLLQGTLLLCRILSDQRWTATLDRQPWPVVTLKAEQFKGGVEIVLPTREGGWPE